MGSKQSGKSFALTFLRSSQAHVTGLKQAARDAVSKGAYTSYGARLLAIARRGGQGIVRFLRANWIGTVVILAATLIFFGPMVTRIGSYSESGDAQFNAWTLNRNHHCIMRDNCPNYADGNIYFPHKDTMLYSETQLSTGLLTLPIYWFTKNPLVPYNVATIAGFFFAGWFMYLLIKRLSRNKELIAVTAGLIFEFAPFKMAGIAHLQNLSILYLPLIVLLILKFLDGRKKRYLFGAFVAAALLFSASWYQMVFALMALGVLLLGMLLFKLASWRTVIGLGVVLGLAAATTLPVAKEYMRFSKESQATFSIADQVYYASDLSDYIIPHQGTVAGKAYHALWPTAQVNSYNPDSYSYHGIVLYVTAIVMLIASWVWWKKHRQDSRDAKLVITFAAIALLGFILSLGPLLKVFGQYTFGNVGDGIALAIPLPFLLIDKVLPQLTFIRAVGRISVLVLFALCCMLAFLPAYLEKFKVRRSIRIAVMAVLLLFVVIELAPLHRVPMANPTSSYAYNITVPPVYEFVRTHDEVDNIIILQADVDYPDAFIQGVVAKNEQVMWAGYHNKNMFNGYSGYTPPTYFRDIADYNDFKPDDVPKLKKEGLRYVIVDKQLSTTNPQLRDNVARSFPQKLYEDARYALFKIQ